MYAPYVVHLAWALLGNAVDKCAALNKACRPQVFAVRLLSEFDLALSELDSGDSDVLSATCSITFPKCRLVLSCLAAIAIAVPRPCGTPAPDACLTPDTPWLCLCLPPPPAVLLLLAAVLVTPRLLCCLRRTALSLKWRRRCPSGGRTQRCSRNAAVLLASSPITT